MPTEAAKPRRLQGCFLSDAEMERLVYLWGNQRQAEPAPLKVENLPAARTNTRKGSAPDDSLLGEARRLAEGHRQISASFLQRRLKIGYPRAARIMDQLEEESAQEVDGDGEEED